MDGVRRWMGSNPPSVTYTTHEEAERDHDTDPNPEVEGPDPASMEGIVWRLLSPSVPEEEEAEYEGFVHSHYAFTHLTAACVSHSYVDQYQALLTSSNRTAERKDLDLYISSAGICQGDPPTSLVSDVPHKAYVAYVETYGSENLAPQAQRVDAFGNPSIQLRKVGWRQRK
jgi:phosphatidylinositol 3,5-bisphosphate 5-phosphatase